MFQEIENCEDQGIYGREIKAANYGYLPINWSEVFGNANPIIVEIGFGNGEYLGNNARSHPEKNFVGFEVSITSMKKAHDKIKDLENVRLTTVDARFGMREFFGPRSVEKVIMNFPIPWDKHSQERRRVILPDFFDTLANVLSDNGTFELVTDVEWYTKQTIEMATSNGLFEVLEYIENPDRGIKTRYEQKWMKYGRNIYAVVLKKVGHVEVERLIGGIHEVPHAKCVIDEGKFQDLNGRVFKEKQKVAVVKGIYKSTNDRSYIIKMISSDEDFQQHYYLNARPEGDTWLIKLDSVSNPYRTPAVKWSVQMIADVLKK
ncbi:MAG TPA: tRNA (guanosine(46)-N7)-methyltransferase TrmB [Fervidobacterium sp.]|nr:tRNA (guanosine(46)-N7)-methyltransferase TrmB [Fervidobacterium sp.]HPT54766.1 tRNA (guanosine(46)-N7)-methyltransferase TrmB [Fervidobacterium sp.]HPZ18226.1 tRNA (guanosine(46)-N7)-methyltransferase TrmB [Fervidobacterium sp.]HQE48719.1 tRNA (guanosine(46)-N7)-methyltransferase TrmB [Fervidobacterium sp.]HUM43292.1 tRNA (guanosine(46)-N7)-methyltransferase TrmB [Fervidobacterium sp.]